MEVIRPTTIKLRSLSAKGQIFKFDGYVECQNAIAELTKHFDRIEAFIAIIRSPTWNWENPEVLRLLKNMMNINPNDIRENIKKNNIVILEFSRDTYKRLYR